MRRRRRGAAHGRAGRRRGGRRRARKPRRGTRRRPRRWPGWPGRSPRRRREVRRASRRQRRRRRAVRRAPFDVQPPVRGRLAQAPRGAGPLRASRAPGHRAKPRREKASRRASASPRVGFCARIGTESLLTEKGAAALRRARRHGDDGAFDRRHKNEGVGADARPRRDARSRARAPRSSRGAPGRRAPGRVGVSLYRTDSNSTATPRAFSSVSNDGEAPIPSDRRATQNVGRLCSPSCARRRSRAATP